MKYKTNRSQEFVIGGYTPGNPFDALIVGYYNGTNLKFVAKVRNGFVPRVRREVFKSLRRLETDSCPFTNLPEKRRTMWALTAEEMKECRWLKPRLVAQIDFTEWTPDAHLRHASFVGLRDDKGRGRFGGNSSTCFTGSTKYRPLSAIQVGGPENDRDDGYDDPAKCLTVCHFLIPLNVAVESQRPDAVFRDSCVISDASVSPNWQLAL